MKSGRLTLVASLIITTLLVGGALLATRESNPIPANNVTMVGGKQVIDLTAKGGYAPRKSTAKAGIPTILRVDTNGTFDCSAAILIPRLNVALNLPPSGSTEIDLGTPTAGVLKGMCSMGMYRFEINFQS